jgi:hypothetical protein
MNDNGGNLKRQAVAGGHHGHVGGWWLPLLLSIVILMIGIGIGSATTALVMNKTFTDAIHKPERGRRMLMEHLIHQLDLSDEKAAEVETLIEDRFSELDELHDEFMPRVMEQLDILEEEVAAVLDPEQEARWREGVARMREFGGRMGRGGPHGEGGPGHGSGEGPGRGFRHGNGPPPPDSGSETDRLRRTAGGADTTGNPDRRALSAAASRRRLQRGFLIFPGLVLLSCSIQPVVGLEDSDHQRNHQNRMLVETGADSQPDGCHHPD